MQEQSEPMQITCAGDMYADLIAEFAVDDVGTADIRGFGEMELMRVTDKAATPVPFRYHDAPVALAAF